HQDEARTCDRPTRLPRLVGKDLIKTRRVLPVGGRGLEGVVVRLHELALLVFHRGVAHLVFLGIRVLDVADRALDPLHVRSDALIALAAHAFRPGDRGAGANLLFPFGADLGKVIGPDEGRARAVRAAHHGDRIGRQLEARIQVGNRLVVPVLDLAEEDVGQNRTREFKLAGGDALEIDYRNYAADDRRKLHQAGLLQIVGLEWHVGGAEVDGLG